MASKVVPKCQRPQNPPLYSALFESNLMYCREYMHSSIDREYFVSRVQSQWYWFDFDLTEQNVLCKKVFYFLENSKHDIYQNKNLGYK